MASTKILVTTTGNTNPVIFNDLASSVVLNHPSIGFDLTDYDTKNNIMGSTSFISHVQNRNIIALDELGIPINSASILNLVGEIDCHANPNYPSAQQGESYKVSVAGKIGGSSGEVVQAGDVIQCLVLNTGGTSAQVADYWLIIQGNVLASSESIAGYLALASQVEVNAGTNDTKAVTPLKLQQRILNAGYDTTATAAGETVLDVNSKYEQHFTGTTTQTATLPVTSTLILGFPFKFVNKSTGAVTINSSGGNAVQVMRANSVCFVTCIALTGTTAASWVAHYIPTSTNSSTAYTNVMRDASGNFSAGTITATLTGNADTATGADNFKDGFATTATAAGTTVLDATSKRVQQFTGSTTQTVTLPVTSTISAGVAYEFINDSSGAVTINSSGSNAVLVLAGGTRGVVTCKDTGHTTAADWTISYLGLNVTDGKKLSVANTMTLQATDNSTLNIGTGGTLGTAAYTAATAYAASATNITKSVVKTIGHVGDTETDFQWATANNANEQTIDLGALLPAKARLIDAYLLCTETADAGTIDLALGLTDSGEEIIASANCDAANDINSTLVGAIAPTVAARHLWVQGTRGGGNWSTLTTAGAWAVFASYVDYDAID